MSDKTEAVTANEGPLGRRSDLTRWQDVVTILATQRGKVAILPKGYPLRSATFSRKGAHLVVEAEHFPQVVVPWFLNGGDQTTVATEDGVEISRHMILLMTNLSSRVALALNALAAPTGK
ncbi:MAG: hypothetical protein HQ494_05575 [Rhodospirillales bacterium]|nr:hypothetical protein [Rhodospirillales bacterium]